MKKVNNYIVTGPPRSGTTLTCFLLNKIEDTIALHEPMNLKMFPSKDVALEETKNFFQSMRRTALVDGTVISKVKEGKIPDNPFGNKMGGNRKSLVSRKEIAVTKALSTDFNLMIKHNGHFTFMLQDLMKEFKCVAVIRNPLSMIASWNTITAPVSRGNLTVLKGLNLEIYNHLESIPDLIDRQISLAHLLYSAYDILPKQHIIKYEDIVSSGGAALSSIIPEAKTLNEPLVSKNLNKIYDKNQIRIISEKLLNFDGAFWDYYSKEDVASLVKFK